MISYLNVYIKTHNIKILGIALIIAGLLFIIFDVSGCKNEKPSFLTDWMDNWGSGGAWAIKIGMVVIGIVMVVASDRKIK